MQTRSWKGDGIVNQNHCEASHIYSLHNCRQHFKTVRSSFLKLFQKNTEEKGKVPDSIKQEFL